MGVLSVPTDETTWSQRLKVYFKALNQYHARRRETPLGILMITNLSGFPSSLTVIPVPEGDLRAHRYDFFVNEDLKRLGCSGRVGLTLAQPNNATVAKFHQLYRTSDKNQLYGSVIELVKLCQAALNLFEKLEIDYADGLLCDMTEKAINDWWTEIGTDIYNTEPHDGILGPTTVAALLGLLMGARNRLNAVGAPVPKDAFDVDGMKRGIAVFQKSQHINRNRRLDRQTLNRLHKSSAKAASAEGWAVPRVPRAVKSTVAELSGKGGEMVMDVVGRRDKAGIADIETCDMERFVQLIYGERCKWLWYGRPLKRTKAAPNGDKTQDHDHLVFKPDEHGGFKWTSRKPTMYSQEARRPDLFDDEDGRSTLHSEDMDKEDPSVKSLVKRATGSLMGEKRSGIGRIKDAVRGHHHRQSKEYGPHYSVEDSDVALSRPSLQRARSTPVSSHTSPREGSFTQALLDNKHRKAEDDATQPHQPLFADTIMETPEKSKDDLRPDASLPRSEPGGRFDGGNDRLKVSGAESASDTATAEPSVTGSIYDGDELEEVMPGVRDTSQVTGILLRRRNSDTVFYNLATRSKPEESYPRHLSFSEAEDSTLDRTALDSCPDLSASATVQQQYEYEVQRAENAKALRAAMADLERNESAWTGQQVDNLHGYVAQADNDQQDLEELYHAPYHHLQELKDVAAGLLREEKEASEEGGKELETLAAKLEYEIESLRGKVGDMEVGVKDFERAVAAVEERVADLEMENGRGGRGCVVS